MLKNKKFLSLELLRFLAAVLVLTHHYFGYQHGFIGVNIFFMISGFVIMYATTINTEYFFLRRLLRIIPLYWLLTILFTMTLIFLPNLISKSYFDLIFLLKSLFFIPFENNGVGPGIGHSPYLFLGWTLNYEIFFYLVFQISILINYKYRGVILVISFVIIQIILKSLNSESFILRTYSHPIIFQFCYGIFIFYLWEFFNYKSKKKKFFIYLFIIFVFFLIYDTEQNLNLKNNLRLYYSAWSLIIILAFIFIFEKIIKNNIFLAMGAVSYPIYLIHPYIKTVFDKVLYLNNNLNFSIYLILLIIINFLVSWLIYYFYEIKIIKKLNYILLNK